MEFLKSLWGTAGMPLPGLVTPTLDTNELDKRVADLKAVEGWLKTNLGMLQMTIQGLEMQRATLAAMQAFVQPTQSPDAGNNPFTNPALWPWQFPQHAASTATQETPAEAATRDSRSKTTADKSAAQTKSKDTPSATS
jgi:hypothetical protein